MASFSFINTIKKNFETGIFKCGQVVTVYLQGGQSYWRRIPNTGDLSFCCNFLFFPIIRFIAEHKAVVIIMLVAFYVRPLVPGNHRVVFASFYVFLGVTGSKSQGNENYCHKTENHFF